MTREQILLLAVSIVPLALVFANKLRLDVAALAMSAALGVAQLAGWSIFGPAHTPLNAVKAIAGFSQPVVLTLFSLFVLTSALERSGAARWLAAHMVAWGGASEHRLILLFTSVSAVLSVFMNNLAAGARRGELRAVFRIGEKRDVARPRMLERRDALDDDIAVAVECCVAHLRECCERQAGGLAQ
jgi:di/tricarboxylate transporter